LVLDFQLLYGLYNHKMSLIFLDNLQSCLGTQATIFHPVFFTHACFCYDLAQLGSIQKILQISIFLECAKKALLYTRTDVASNSTLQSVCSVSFFYDSQIHVDGGEFSLRRLLWTNHCQQYLLVLSGTFFYSILPMAICDEWWSSHSDVVGNPLKADFQQFSDSDIALKMNSTYMTNFCIFSDVGICNVVIHQF